MWISWIAIIIAVVAALVVAFDERALKNRTSSGQRNREERATTVGGRR